jgi:hypothetical protein
LQARSFDLAAEAYCDAVGGSISGDSVRRITQGWGKAVEAQRGAEAERANAPAQLWESPRGRRVAEVEPIRGQANLSTDGAMVLIRDEGWKEVKLTAVSEVEVRATGERAAGESRPSRREQEPRVALSRHSYQVGLWDADTMALHQYSEGLRRGVDRCQQLSSVNDGAPWIERITYTNFPEAVQVVDWYHASERLWQVAHTVFGQGTAQEKAWVEGQLDLLWRGQVAKVAMGLEGLDLDQERYPSEVRQAPGYFQANQTRMRYDYFREAGYPIGSGTVESAANNVVHHRMRRPGRGWQRDNAQAMLAGLSELDSGLPETIEARSAVIADLRSAQHLTLDFFDEERQVRMDETQCGGWDAMAFDVRRHMLVMRMRGGQSGVIGVRPRIVPIQFVLVRVAGAAVFGGLR